MCIRDSNEALKSTGELNHAQKIMGAKAVYSRILDISTVTIFSTIPLDIM